MQVRKAFMSVSHLYLFASHRYLFGFILSCLDEK